MKYQKSQTTFIIFTITLMSLLISCNSKPPEGDHIIQIRKADFINIGLDNLLSISNIIPLESSSESIIMNYALYLNNSDGIFVNYGILYHFDNDGRFIKTIGARGKGPGEFTSIKDAAVSKDGFEFLNGPSTTISFFNHDGKFIITKRIIDHLSESFIIHPKSRDYFFYTSKHDYRIYQVDGVSLMLKDSFLINDNNFSNGGLDNLIITDDGTCLCFELNNYNIYEITEDSVKIRYSLDFGKKYPDITYMNNAKRRNHYKTNNSWSLRHVQENQDWLYLWIRHSISYDDNLSNMHHLLFEKSTGKIYNLPGELANNDYFMPAFLLDNNNNLSLYIDPLNIVDITTWNKHLEKLNSNYDLIDNHVVVRVRLNDLIE